MRVEVRLALGDLADLSDARISRQALRGVTTVIHLAASIRDQPNASVEEVNGLATARLLRAAERSGVERFVFFSALNASEFQRTRFFRAKALAEGSVAESPLATTVFAPSIIYDRDDPWVTIQRRLALLPAIPISGHGDAAYQPIWAQDVAECMLAALDRDGDGSGRYELAGPDTLTYDEIARLIARAAGHERPLFHVPLGFVRAGLNGLRRAVGDAAFATWEEAELMEVPMTTARGTADAEKLGVEPRSMAAVLG
jgi:NADH dehydrogenase